MGLWSFWPFGLATTLIWPSGLSVIFLVCHHAVVHFISITSLFVSKNSACFVDYFMAHAVWDAAYFSTAVFRPFFSSMVGNGSIPIHLEFCVDGILRSWNVGGEVWASHHTASMGLDSSRLVWNSCCFERFFINENAY